MTLTLLQPYKETIEQALRRQIAELGDKSALRDACEYALLSGGKRFRPSLVLLIAKALGFGVDVTQAALGVEFFHTATLIADDLPCMDNDDVRRGKKTTHRVFGESVALLATYALISAAYGTVAKSVRALEGSLHPYAHERDLIGTLVLENVTENTGLFGVTGGQFLDLSPYNLSLDLAKEVIHKKTGTLFEVSFVFGWLFGGGDRARLEEVKKSAAHFGLAFQIADDLDDVAQDSAQSLNVVHLLGRERAAELFHVEIERFKKSLAPLGLDKSELLAIADSLS